MTIHNPLGIVLSKKDVEQGWRFCFREELLVARPRDSKFRNKGDRSWCDTFHPGAPVGEADLQKCTYITKAPAPNSVPAAATPDSELDTLVKFLGGQ